MDEKCKDRGFKYSCLKEYLDGGPSDEKKQLLISWFENPELRYKLEYYLKELWKETDPDKVTNPSGFDVMLDRIHHKINLTQTVDAQSKRHGQHIPAISLYSVLKNLSRVAAILLLPLMIYLGWEVVNQKMWEKNQPELVYNEFICPLGVRSQFELPDGTTGWLNNGSRLKYPAKFLGKSREIELIGEAYFDVTHDKRRPFIINTDGLDVRVLGTKLNVCSYPNEKTQTFTLETGLIELIYKENGVDIPILTMEPGQHAVFTLKSIQGSPSEYEETNEGETIIIGDQKPDDKSKLTISQSIKSANTLNGYINLKSEKTYNYTAWKDGKLILRNDPMPTLLRRIERWYNVKFIVTDERINEYKYWATFEEENLDQVLSMLSLTGPIRFKKHPREQLEDNTLIPQVIDILMKE